jgi:hypothetical protein
MPVRCTVFPAGKKRNGDLFCSKRSPPDIPATKVTGRVKLPLLWLVYSGRVSPIISSRLPSLRNLAASSFRFPHSEIIPGLSLLLRNLHPPSWSGECCPPCGFLLSLFLFPERAFYLLLDSVNILSRKREKQFFRLWIMNKFQTWVINKCS